MGQDQLVGEWMGQREAAEAAIGQPSDLLLDLGEGA
jgi:hypothetical protein